MRGWRNVRKTKEVHTDANESGRSACEARNVLEECVQTTGSSR